jgi:hypothetical protein
MCPAANRDIHDLDQLMSDKNSNADDMASSSDLLALPSDNTKSKKAFETLMTPRGGAGDDFDRTSDHLSGSVYTRNTNKKSKKKYQVRVEIRSSS